MFGDFLEHLEAAPAGSAGARMLPLALVTAGTGLRLGEVLGLRWSDVAEDGTITGRQQAQQVGKAVEYVRPKTAAGTDRVVAVGPDTLGALRSWKAQQSAQRLAWGAAWTDTGLVFTAEDGSGLLPQSVSKAFARLVEVHKMPHATFHGLRHLQASVLLDADVSMAVVSKRLGHSSIKLTVDTYHHMTRRTDEDAAARGDAALARRRVAT